MHARFDRYGRFRRYGRSRRGISEVIGTILLLGLTVTLFGTVFLFVNTFPRPPPQPTGQFSATLTYTTAVGYGTIIGTVNIAHLAGPTVFNVGGTNIWISSAAKPSAFTGPYTVANGLSGASSWSIGQTWTVNVAAYHLTIPDNLTISIVQGNSLLFRQTLPGSSPSVPPQFTNYGLVPASPVVGNTFKVYAQITDPYLSTSSTAVLLNYSLLPGFSTAVPVSMTYSSSSGTWSYTVPASSTPAVGTYFVFISATDSVPLSNSVAIPVTIVAASTAPTAPLSVSLALNVSAPVTGLAATILATVTDIGTAGGTVTAKFVVGSTTLGTNTGAITPGGTITIASSSWTPSAIGAVVLNVQASIPGVGIANGTETVIVYPPILLFAHNTAYSAAGSVKTYVSPADEASWLANALTADGVPYTATASSCKSALPAASNTIYPANAVIIVDYGSSSSPGCGSQLIVNDMATLATLAASHSVWIVGSNAWSTSTACTSLSSSSFKTIFGLKTAASGACAASVTLPSSGGGVYTSTVASGLRGDAVQASYSINATVAGNSTFSAYTLSNAFQSGASATTFFKIGGTVAGTFYTTGGNHEVILGFDPSMLVRTLPAPGSQAWGSGGAAAEITYNIMDYLTGITPAGAANSEHPVADFGVSEVQLIGTSHKSTTTVQALIRCNGLVGGEVGVELLVNGTPTDYQGTYVVQTLYFANSAVASTFVTLLWQAPTGGPYTLTVVVLGGGGIFAANNEMGATLFGTPSTFY